MNWNDILLKLPNFFSFKNIYAVAKVIYSENILQKILYLILGKRESRWKVLFEYQ